MAILAVFTFALVTSTLIWTEITILASVYKGIHKVTNRLVAMEQNWPKLALIA